MTLLVVLVGVAFAGAYYFLGSIYTVEKISRIVIADAINQTKIRLSHLFENVDRTLAAGRDYVGSGEVDLHQPAQLNRVFMPVLRRFPQISSMHIADMEGREYLLLRKGDEWLNRLTDRPQWGGRTLWHRWTASGQLAESTWKELDYDPRKRPWFQGAIAAKEADTLFWTEPYTFFTTKDPGITASLRLDTEADPGRAYVVSFDVLLLDISQFTTGLMVGEHGSAFVLTEDERVIGLPMDDRFTDLASIKASVLRKIGDLDLDTVRAFIEKWKRDRSPALTFRGKGGDWRGGIESHAMPGLRLLVGVVVPESDFLEDVKLRALIVLLIMFMALVAAIFIASAISRRFSEPLVALAADSRRITNLDLRPSERSSSNITEFRQLAETHDQMLSALRSFSRYVPMDVVRELMQRGEVARIGGRVEYLTVLFTDIEDFTGIAERMAPDRLAVHLSEYFNSLLEIMLAHDATVDKFIGDSIMAFWGAPQPNPDHVKEAVESILQCGARLGRLNAAWTEGGLPALPTRFGLATGELVVGNFGAEERLAYTVIGDTVNLASRLQVLCRDYGTDVLVSGESRTAAGDGFAWRLVDRVAVRGKSEAVEVYELLGESDRVSAADKRDAAAYEEALELYHAGDFRAALERTAGVPSETRFHVSVRRLRDLCAAEVADRASDN